MNIYRHTFSAVVAICFLIANGCSKQSDYSPGEKSSPAMNQAVSSSDASPQSLDMKEEAAPESSEKKKARSEAAPTPSAPSVSSETSPQEIAQKQPEIIDLKQISIPAKGAAWGRSLAYTISLSYTCDKFLDARKQLIAIVPRYGFLISSETSIDEYSSSLNAVFKIRVDSLYNFIEAIQSIGHLQHEQINGIDHTGDLFFAALQIQRQKERITRKADIIASTRTSSRAFDYREEDLMNQEDKLDQVEYDKWQFNDRIDWIEIHVQLNGPQKVYQENVAITVPEYKKHMFAVISGILNLSIVLIYVLPYLIIIGAVVWGIWFLVRKYRIK
jgi:Domain of unknown function (DUF4349)